MANLPADRMKSKKWNSFKNGYARLIVLTIVSISGGLSMLLVPEKTSHWIIRSAGLIWILEGITYGFDIWIKYIKR